MYELLKKYLAEVAPLLSLDGEDEKILMTCGGDLKNYIRYLKNQSKGNFDAGFLDFTMQKAIDETWFQFEPIPTSEMEKELDIFLKDWAFIWWKKFQERTELSIKKEIPQASLDIATKGRLSLTHYWTQEERDELEEYIVNIFYDAGEYCCTATLAHSIMEQYLGQNIWQEKKVFTQADKLEFMHIVGTEARRMSQTKGKLIYIKADLKSYLREWRNDNTTTQFK